MHGLVSLLSNPYYAIVEDLWKDLEKKFGLSGIKVTPFPHFSWLVAQDFNFDKLEREMQQIAEKTKPFILRTAGVGIFSGDSPIIYISIAKNEHLLTLHQSIYQRFSRITEGLVPYYEPNKWIPHISVAYSDISKENIGKVLKYLSFKNFHWEIKIDNLAFIFEPTGSVGELRYKFPFHGI